MECYKNRILIDSLVTLIVQRDEIALLCNTFSTTVHKLPIMITVVLYLILLLLVLQVGIVKNSSGFSSWAQSELCHVMCYQHTRASYLGSEGLT